MKWTDHKSWLILIVFPTHAQMHTKYNTNKLSQQFLTNVIILKKQFSIVPMKFVCPARYSTARNTHIHIYARMHCVHGRTLEFTFCISHKLLNILCAPVLIVVYPHDAQTSIQSTLFCLSKRCRLYVSIELCERNSYRQQQNFE